MQRQRNQWKMRWKASGKWSWKGDQRQESHLTTQLSIQGESLRCGKPLYTLWHCLYLVEDERWIHCQVVNTGEHSKWTMEIWVYWNLASLQIGQICMIAVFTLIGMMGLSCQLRLSHFHKILEVTVISNTTCINNETLVFLTTHHNVIFCKKFLQVVILC